MVANAYRDENGVPTILGASSVDGQTPIRLYANPTTHRLLVDSAAGVTGPVSSTDTALVRWNGVAGATVQDSSVTLDATKSGVVSSVVFSQTATKTVVNTAVETALDSTGVGSKTLPANFFIAGRTISFLASGFHSAGGNPTIQLRLKFGATLILDTTAVTSGNGTNNFWEVRGTITCYTTGVGGTVWAQGFYTESGGGANSFSMVNTAAITVDTTATQAVTLTVQWGTAALGNTTTCTNLLIEALN